MSELLVLLMLLVFYVPVEVQGGITEKGAELILKKKIFVEGGVRHVYHFGKTLADLHVDKEYNILECSLFQVGDSSEKREVIEELKSAHGVSVHKLKLVNMLDMIHRCNYHPSAQKIVKAEHQGVLDKHDIDVNLEFSKAARMIVPGTLWCGAGQIADQYSNLGPDYQLDRCCRQHDFCPLDVMRFTLQNPTPYTQVACLCDEILYKCLKKLGSTSANDVGKVFFNIIQMRCVDIVEDENKTPKLGKIIKKSFLVQL